LSRASRRAPVIGPRSVRLVLATLCAIAVLAIAPRGTTPGNGGPFGFVAGPPVAAAASPEPSAPGGDTRSVGEGPGLVGAPFLAIIGILALGLLAAGATVLYLRLTAGPNAHEAGPGDAQERTRPRRRG
jgi:hypothetical protein